jgi:hypothetical protein
MFRQGTSLLIWRTGIPDRPQWQKRTRFSHAKKTLTEIVRGRILDFGPIVANQVIAAVRPRPSRRKPRGNTSIAACNDKTIPIPSKLPQLECQPARAHECNLHGFWGGHFGQVMRSHFSTAVRMPPRPGNIYTICLAF